MTQVCLLDPSVYSRCLDHLAEVKNLDFVVKDSIPIPYFGNLAAYLKSPLRVLTAAINPSDEEFPADVPRFDVQNGLQGPQELEEQLSNYFLRNPYGEWFGSFEPLLNGMDASYGGKMALKPFDNTALHIDLCSPIATSPTWSGLKRRQLSILKKVGREIFEVLIDKLTPNIIVASLSWKHLQKWNAYFEDGQSWDRVLQYDKKPGGDTYLRPLVVQAKTLRSSLGHPFLFANASAANKPLLWFSPERKFEAGAALRACSGGSH